MVTAPTQWKKRYLIPFWVIRIFFMVMIIGFYGWALHYAKNTANAPQIAVVVLFMLLLIICLLLDIMAIVLFARDALHPKTFLIFNVIQSSIWFIIVILDIVAIARGTSAAGLALSIFIFLSFLALLIYSVVKFRRQKAEQKRGHYAPAVNPANHLMQPQQYGNTPSASSGTAVYPHSPADFHAHPQPPQGAATEYYSQPYNGAHGQYAPPQYAPPQYAPPATSPGQGQKNPFADEHHQLP